MATTAASCTPCHDRGSYCRLAGSDEDSWRASDRKRWDLATEGRTVFSWELAPQLVRLWLGTGTNTTLVWWEMSVCTCSRDHRAECALQCAVCTFFFIENFSPSLRGSRALGSPDTTHVTRCVFCLW